MESKSQSQEKLVAAPEEQAHRGGCCQWLVTAFVHFVLWLIRVIFFKAVEHFGVSNIPPKGPVIFVCAPHANQFLDPIVVTAGLTREIGFLSAKKSVDRKDVGPFIRAMNGIPVRRPQDERVKMAGTVRIIVEGGISEAAYAEEKREEKEREEKGDAPAERVASAPSADVTITVKGQGTAFTEMPEGSSLYVAELKIPLRVEKIISDTELIVSAGQGVEDKPASYYEALPPSAIKSEPKIDQTEVFDTVFNHLGAGNCIGIFPEGGSHDRTSMLPLKAGVTIMALGAMAKFDGLDVLLVPCGLNYFAPHKFRSHAYVEFGEPIRVKPELVEMYKKGKADKRAACAQLLEEVYQGLKSVTVNVPDSETLQMLQMVRRLYNPGRKLTVNQKLELHRRFALGLEKYKDEPRVQTIVAGVQTYFDTLKGLGIRDHNVAKVQLGTRGPVPGARGPFKSFLLLIWRIIKLFIMVALAIPGLIIFGPVGLYASHVSEQKRQEALAGSIVKVKARDVISTWKVMTASVLIPLVLLFWSVVVAVILNVDFDILSWHDDIPLWVRIAAPFACFFVIFPFAGYSTTRFVESSFATLFSLRPLLANTISCCGFQQNMVSLAEARLALGKAIAIMVEKLGPDVLTGGDKEAFKQIRVVPQQQTKDHFEYSVNARGSVTAKGAIALQEVPHDKPTGEEAV